MVLMLRFRVLVLPALLSSGFSASVRLLLQQLRSAGVSFVCVYLASGIAAAAVDLSSRIPPPVGNDDDADDTADNSEMMRVAEAMMIMLMMMTEMIMKVMRMTNMPMATMVVTMVTVMVMMMMLIFSLACTDHKL